MANEYIADGIYRVSGLETTLKNGSWVSDAGTYLVTGQAKLASIPGAKPGDVAFTAGYTQIWQLNTDGTTWVEMPKTSASTAATAAAASATEAAASAATATAVKNSIPQDYTTLSNDVVDLKSAIEERIGDITIDGYESGYITTSGATVNIASVTSESGYVHNVVDCREGDHFLITGKGGSSPRLWCFIDGSSNAISRAYESIDASADTLEIIAPHGAVKLVVNFVVSAGYNLVKAQYTGLMDVDNEQNNNIVNGVGFLKLPLFEGLSVYNKTDVLPANFNKSSYYASNVFPCEEGDWFTVKGVNLSGNYYIWAFHDADGLPVRHAGTGNVTQGVFLQAQSGEKYLSVVFRTDYETAPEYYVYRGKYYGQSLLEQKADKNNVDVLEAAVFGEKEADIIPDISTYSDGTSGGITYTKDSVTNTVTASGTRSGASFRTIKSSSNSLPDGIVAGGRYDITFVSGSQYLGLYLIYYLNGSEKDYEILYETSRITIPDWATGFTIRFQTFTGWPTNGSATITFPTMTAVKYDNGLIGEAEKIPENEKEEFNRAHFINKQLSELNELKNYTDDAINGLMKATLNEGTTKSITLSGLPKTDKMYARLSLHYGASAGTPSQEDVFFDGSCEKDFSDVRFFDSNGKMLKAMFSPAVNMDLIQDSKLNKLQKVTASGKLIRFFNDDDNGIWISTDNGANYTQIPGTENATEHASAAYNLTSLCPVYVDEDDNIFAYAGGKMYKMLASDNYATKTEVLDFSWVNDGTTIYPDCQPHSFVKSAQGGVLFCAPCYQVPFHVSIYKSTDNGATWSLTWHSWTGNTYQHVHQMHADPFSNRVYAGIDDNAGTWSGSRIIYTDDDGANWTEVDPDARIIRGKDFYPVYFGDGTYKLGGGETYLMGSGTIYRSKDDIHFDIPVLGLSGIRANINDFGDDSLILSGSGTTTLSAENHLFMSTDKGKSWKSIFTKYQNYFKSANTGFRFLFNYTQLIGDTEPCMILSEARGGVDAMRIYKGGNHYFREVFVELENTDGSATITAKTGYAMEYPYKILQKQDDTHLIYEIPLNEGCGIYVEDAKHNIAQIYGARSWDSKQSVRFGEYQGETTKFLYYPSSGVRIEKESKLTFPANSDLNYTKNYSVSMWVNPAMVASKLPNDEHYSEKLQAFRHLVTIGEVSFVMCGRSCLGIIRNNVTPKWAYYLNKSFPYSGMRFAEGMGILNSDQYFHYMFTVDDDGVVKAYVNGCPASEAWTNDASNALGNLSNGEIKFGTSWDGGNVGYISDVRVYDKAYSAADVMMIYRGWKPYSGD